MNRELIKTILKYTLLLLLVGVAFSFMVDIMQRTMNEKEDIPIISTKTYIRIYCNNNFTAYDGMRLDELFINSYCYYLKNNKLNETYENQKWKDMNMIWKIGNKTIGVQDE